VRYNNEQLAFYYSDNKIKIMTSAGYSNYNIAGNVFDVSYLNGGITGATGLNLAINNSNIDPSNGKLDINGLCKNIGAGQTLLAVDHASNHLYYTDALQNAIRFSDGTILINKIESGPGIDLELYGGKGTYVKLDSTVGPTGDFVVLCGITGYNSSFECFGSAIYMGATYNSVTRSFNNVNGFWHLTGGLPTFSNALVSIDPSNGLLGITSASLVNSLSLVGNPVHLLEQGTTGDYNVKGLISPDNSILLNSTPTDIEVKAQTYTVDRSATNTSSAAASGSFPTLTLPANTLLSIGDSIEYRAVLNTSATVIYSFDFSGNSTVPPGALGSTPVIDYFVMYESGATNNATVRYSINGSTGTWTGIDLTSPLSIGISYSSNTGVVTLYNQLLMKR